jgi:hypothetical protein
MFMLLLARAKRDNAVMTDDLKINADEEEIKSKQFFRHTPLVM